MKSPAGNDTWCEVSVSKRVRELRDVCSWLTKLSSAHTAICLLRYQTSRMVFTAHTTPGDTWLRALAAADGTIQVALDSIVACAAYLASARAAPRIAAVSLAFGARLEPPGSPKPIRRHMS